ncbi:MAG: tripartite tricarboxylate transporter substrate binding protein [Betaproteobacteria bacterium]|nr:tripartite tricarboxylate transporter substrate binding protein [Betaproteobacteria bacterium]MBI3938196.1 tripartite tricarboxylate transporter substrate binding protein [Betaproteobacteria bacterium]
MRNIRLLLCNGLGALLALFVAAAAAADSYPTKPVRLIIPFPPGGSNDIVGRMMGAELTERLGKQVIVDNRGGAGGSLGAEITANSDPDGYTIVIISVAYAFNPSLYKLRFNPEKAFTPVSILGTGPNALVVFPKLPVNSVKELLAMAKARPGALNYASAGVGSFQHLGSELFRIMAGINIVHVPFKGGGPAMADVIAGNTQVSLGSLIQMIPHVNSGRLKILGIGSLKRSPAMPNVPTIAESGVPGYDASNWWGILAPAGTPPAVVKRLNTELNAILAKPDIQKKFESQGAETLRMTPAEFGKHIRAETAKWSKVVKQAGIKAE